MTEPTYEDSVIADPNYLSHGQISVQEQYGVLNLVPNAVREIPQDYYQRVAEHMLSSGISKISIGGYDKLNCWDFSISKLINNLANIPNLNIQINYPDYCELEHILTDMNQAENVKSFKVWMYSPTAEDFTLISNKLPSLESLSLTATFGCIQTFNQASFTPLQSMPHLRKIDLLHFHVNQDGLIALRDLELKHLHINGHISYENLVSISEMATLKSLGVDIVKDFSELSRMTELEELVIEGGHTLTTENYNQIACAPSLTSLSIDVFDSTISRESISVISRMTNLKKLSLTADGAKGLPAIDDKDIYLLNSLELEELTIKLGKASIVESDTGDKDSKSLFKIPSLKVLCIISKKTADFDFMSLANLQNLEVLDLNSMKLSESKVEQLIELINKGTWPNLREVELGIRNGEGYSFSEEVMGCLSTVLSENTLRNQTL
jgi:hypothetical protein